MHHPHHARNTLLLAAVEVGWGFGFSLIQFESILPVFVRELGGSWLVIALLPALVSTASLPFELLSGIVTEPLERKRAVVYVGHCVCVLFPIALGAYFFAQGDRGAPSGSLATLYAAYFLFFASIGFLSPVWYEFMGKILDPGRRGRAFALVFALQTLAGVLGARAAKAILTSSLPFPRNYGVCYVAAGVTALIATQAFLWTKEESEPAPASPARAGNGRGALRAGLGRLGEVLADRTLRRYLYARAVTRFYPLVVGLYAVQATAKLGAARAGDLATAFLSGRILGTLALSSGDRIGFRPIVALGIAGLGAAGALLSALDALDPDGRLGAAPYFVVAALSGAYTSVEYGGNASLLLNLAPRGRGAAFIAISNAVVWPFTVAAGVTTGLLAERFGPARVQGPFALLFLAAAVYVLVAVREPRRAAS